jgi:hypothetical protein
MINEEDVAKHYGLPLEQRFYLTERLARQRLADARTAVAGSNDWPTFDEFDYMIEVLAAAEAFGIEELGDWRLPQDNDDRSRDICRSFRGEATKVSQRLMLKYAGVPNPDPNTVALDAATKEKLRFHLGQVRGIVDKDPMPDWKKQDLYDAIAELEREIDKARTRIAAVIDVLGKAWDGEVRAMDALRQVVTIIQDAKAAERKAAAVAAPIEPRRIEGPKPKALAAPKPKAKKNGFDKALDDEIPF